uniref:Uncharacterized protein n=1 Tax=Chromera velia CCMP2878 TaxID=1169474 RepID=A0A0G4H9B9_9ALVE|eukprot:Cvel_5974.t1-p1 / transcript=Cvel_5974.t1 / gene=Cvel_5974 / organism=Chromera_velia_CCMP2878 / gene_product=hypothetical protein / transcript_product=hypothetical protein / location=Cvel_scaffold286:34829-35611(+) / protein_length=261 / sequence_SO=supercontig / SO=protein_coding / is_pseudo=false
MTSTHPAAASTGAEKGGGSPTFSGRLVAVSSEGPPRQNAPYFEPHTMRGRAQVSSYHSYTGDLTGLGNRTWHHYGDERRLNYVEFNAGPCALFVGEFWRAVGCLKISFLIEEPGSLFVGVFETTGETAVPFSAEQIPTTPGLFGLNLATGEDVQDGKSKGAGEKRVVSEASQVVTIQISKVREEWGGQCAEILYLKSSGDILCRQVVSNAETKKFVPVVIGHLPLPSKDSWSAFGNALLKTFEIRKPKVRMEVYTWQNETE